MVDFESGAIIFLRKNGSLTYITKSKWKYTQQNTSSNSPAYIKRMKLSADDKACFRHVSHGV